MSILTKILLGLVVLAILPVFYFSAAVLNVQGAWRTKVAEFKTALERQNKMTTELEYGSELAQRIPYVPGKPLKPGQVLGVSQLVTARNNLVLSTGRVWYATRVTDSINAKDGTLKMSVYDSDVENVQFGVAAASGGRKEQTDHGLTPNTVVYIFQMAHNGTPSPQDRYIGEFAVGAGAETFIPLKPTRPMTADQWTKLAEGDVQWIVYDKMPLDSRDLFVGMTEDEIRSRVPASVADEYVNDNQIPTEAVLADEKLKQYVEGGPDLADQRFLRPLRQYEEIFNTGRARLEEMVDKLQVLKKENDYAMRGKENAEKIIVALDARKAKLEAEKLVVEAELKVVQEHSEKLAVAVDEMKQELSKLLADSKRRNEAPPVGGKTAAVPALDAGAALGPN